MFADGGRLSALLRQSYKHGYDIVLGTIVEHMGELPSAGTAITVHQKLENQDIIWDVAMGDIQAFKASERAREAKMLPLTWGGPLFQGEDLRIVAVNGRILSILEHPGVGAMLLDGNRIVWAGAEGMAIFRAYHPAKGLEAQRWAALEAIDWWEAEEE